MLEKRIINHYNEIMSTGLMDKSEISEFEKEPSDKLVIPETNQTEYDSTIPIQTEEISLDVNSNTETAPSADVEAKLAQVATKSVLSKPTKPASRSRKLNKDQSSTSADASGIDPVYVYLSDIGKKPLLTKADEVELSIAIKAGAKAKEILNDSEVKLSIKEKRDYKRQIREGDEATSKFIESNLRLVVSIAKKFQGKGLDLLDLIQEGNIGMMHAVEKFDHTKGFKFSTYATWWIRQAVGRAIADKSRTIRIPVHADDTVKRYHKARFTFIEEFGVEPTIHEIAFAMDLSPEKVIELINISRDTVSLEEPIGEDHQIGDTIADKNAEDEIEKSIRDSVLSSELEKLLSVLDERERLVIERRWGLVDGETRTLENVGEEFGLTRERIRQIEAKAIKKMRHPFSKGDRTVIQ